MEHKTLTKCSSQLQTLNPSKPPNLHLLASIHSLITNPSTSQSTISSISTSLLNLLNNLNHHPNLQIHIIHLYLTLPSQHHPHLFHSILSNQLYTHENTRLAADSLSASISISNTDVTLRPALDEIGCGNVFVSLCFRPCVAVRAWLLSNFERFRVRQDVLVSVLLGFSKDPYPNVRRIALDGMVKVCKFVEVDEDAVAMGCYCRAAELLQDEDDCVRRAAVRAVFEWGQTLVVSSQGLKKKERSDTLFIQVCALVRDMNAQVRIEAFNCIGNIESVTTEILLQSLSKKVLMSTKSKMSLGHLNYKQLQYLASTVAGAYAHGLEDELSEVRESACRSLKKWTVSAPEFSAQAVNWLVDVLNDDSYSVRLSALETMHHMAINQCLKLQGAHLHMFLGTLVDVNLSIRSTTRKVLGIIKFSSLEMFKTAVNGIINSLESYHQDEADVISLLFTIGKSHGNFVISIVNKIAEEVVPHPDGKIRPNSGRVTASLALAVSASFSNSQYICKIPPVIYSYAFTLLRRISRGLIDIMDERILIARLVKCSALTCSSTDYQVGESFLHLFNRDSLLHGEINNINLDGILDEPVIIDHKEAEKDCMLSSLDTVLETRDKFAEYTHLILDKFESICPLIQSGSTEEVHRMLRYFRQEVRKVLGDKQEYSGVLFFLLHYFEVVELLAKVWQQCTQLHAEGMLHPFSHTELNIVLEKLELILRQIRYRIIGLNCEEEFYLMELVVLTHLLRLSSLDLCSSSSFSKLSAALSFMENLFDTGSVKPSRFIVELQKTLANNIRVGKDFTGKDNLKKLLNLFVLRRLNIYPKLWLLKAELDVPGNNSENSLPFVPCLPTSVLLKVTLYYTSTRMNLWVRMKMDNGMVRFVYLDHNHFSDCSDITSLMCTLPFYNTPKGISFTLKISIGVECIHEKDMYVAEKDIEGPKCDLAYLCEDVDIYFSKCVND